MSYGLLIRESDGKCRAVDNQRKPLTGWYDDGMKVHSVMLRKQRQAKEKGDGS